MSDDKVISFTSRGPKAQPGCFDKDDAGLGYNLVPETVAREILRALRAGDDRGLATFVVRKDGVNKTITTLPRRGARTMTDAFELRECEAYGLRTLKYVMRGSRVDVTSDGDALSMVCMRGAEETYGVCFLDDAKGPKGVMAAALLLYAFAIVNALVDQDLFENAFAYLPFVPQIGLDFGFYLEVEHLVDKYAGNP